MRKCAAAIDLFAWPATQWRSKMTENKGSLLQAAGRVGTMVPGRRNKRADKGTQECIEAVSPIMDQAGANCPGFYLRPKDLDLSSNSPRDSPSHGRYLRAAGLRKA